MAKRQTKKSAPPQSMMAGMAAGFMDKLRDLDTQRKSIMDGAMSEAMNAAKAAVAHFARSLSVELAEYGIRVNNVAPDITPTPGMGMISEGSASFMDPLGAAIALPMARVGVPEDVSGAVVFLLSGLSKYITGTTLHPDGGTWAASGWFNWPDEGYRNVVPDSLLEHLRPPASA